MRIIKRAPIPRYWWKQAACRDMDVECFSQGNPENDTARTVCITDCKVREFCLRDALYYGDVCIIRGGVMFIRKRRSLCSICLFPVASAGGLCYVCKNYDPCYGQCGRMVPLYTGDIYCSYCLKEQEEQATWEAESINLSERLTTPSEKELSSLETTNG